jgi:hypothetical protein
VCLTKTNGHVEPGASESTESKLKEARGTAELATPPAVNAAMVIKEFGERFGDLGLAALTLELSDKPKPCKPSSWRRRFR